jgi:hypothetical protein
MGKEKFMVNRKVQPVSFNLSDPYEKELFNYATSKGAFSKYIKRLIQREKEGVFTFSELNQVKRKGKLRF